MKKRKTETIENKIVALNEKIKNHKQSILALEKERDALIKEKEEAELMELKYILKTKNISTADVISILEDTKKREKQNEEI